MFVTFEGIEGMGKTTQLQLIAGWLRARHLSVLVTREPGGTPIGDEIRTLLLAQREEPMVAMAELLLMFGARAQHIETVIQPALQKKQWVLCDRFTDATYAYQGGGRGMDTDTIATLENLVQGGVRPDLTLVFDAPVSIGLARVTQRPVSGRDRFEQEKGDFFERARAVYLEHARQDTVRYRIVDASGSVADVQKQIIEIFEHVLSHARH